MFVALERKTCVVKAFLNQVMTEARLNTTNKKKAAPSIEVSIIIIIIIMATNFDPWWGGHEALEQNFCQGCSRSIRKI